MQESSFKTKEVSEMNRSERRNRLKFYKKEFKVHNKNKPVFDINIFDDLSIQESEERQIKLKAWVTRYGILLRKLQELGWEK